MQKKHKTLINNVLKNECDFRQLFMQYYAPLCVVSAIYLKDKIKAEDIVQQVFLHILESNALQRIDNSVKGYLFTAVRNACLNDLKKEQKNRMLQVDHQTEAEAQYTLDFLLDNERTHILEKALEVLSPHNRSVFELVHLDELSYAEAAERLNVSINTIKYHLKTALQTLRNSPLLKTYFSDGN